MTGGEASVPEPRRLGVSARLFLAFFGISVFAILGAAAGNYASLQVGERLERIDARVPRVASSMQISRAANRLMASTPALLAAASTQERDEIAERMRPEIDHLTAGLADIQRGGSTESAATAVEPLVTSFRSNLAELENLVGLRLKSKERLAALLREAFQANQDTEQLFAPWFQVMEMQINRSLRNPRDRGVESGAPSDGELAASVARERTARTAQHGFSNVVEQLVRTATAGDRSRLPVVDFEIRRGLDDLEARAKDLDPKLRRLFIDQVVHVRQLAIGPDAILATRRQEFDLIGKAEKLIGENADVSTRLDAAVNRLVSETETDIVSSTGDALSVQRLSGNALLVLAALSLLGSVLIVWLYVGRNLIRRLMSLNDGMLAIVAGRQLHPIEIAGSDEVAEMGRVVEIFRKNTLERDALLVEKAQAADRLEQQVEERTGELAKSVEELRALGQVTQAVNSTVDLATVLTTIVVKATHLSNTDAGAIYVFDDARQEFLLRATCGLSDAIVTQLKDSPIRFGQTALSEAVERRTPIQIPDIQEHPSVTLDIIVQAGFRALLYVPLLGAEKIVGALVVRRMQSGEFPKRTVELLQTFADQAVIAIENARLFDEVQARTDDLGESLRQQTATADVLKVISRSAFDLQHVFETVVESAVRLCEADRAFIFRFDGELLRVVAAQNASKALGDFVASNPIRPDRHSAAGRCALERRVVHIPDVIDDSEYNYASKAVEPPRTILAAPMLKGDELLGVILVYHLEVKPFTDKQIGLVATFADQAAIAIENARLFDAVQTRTQDLTESLEQQVATSSILRAIAGSPTDIRPVLDTVAASATELCEAHDAAIFLRRGEALVLAAHHGPISFDFTEWPVGRDWVTGRAVVDRAPVHVHDLLDDSNEFSAGREMAQRIGHRTTLAIPLLREDDAMGALLIRRLEVRPFTTQQVELLKTFADQAVIAIENVRLFEAVEARTRELSATIEQQTATSEVLRVIASSPNDLQPVFDMIAERAAKLCGAAASTVTRFDGEWVHLGALYGSSPATSEPLRRAFPMRPDAGGGAARAIAARAIVHIPDVTADPEYRIQSAAIAAGFNALLSVPMMRRGEAIGAITVGKADTGAFTEAQVQLLRTFAEQALIAIENVTLFEKDQERTRELSLALEQQTATADVLKIISRSAFDVQAVLDTLLESAARLCGADIATIRSRDGETYHLAATYGCTPEWRDHFSRYSTSADRGSVFGRTIVDRHTVHIPDVLADSDFNRPEAQKLMGFRAALGVPMLREGEVMGVLNMFRFKPGSFTKQQIELVTTFADQAAIAIENARLFDEVQARTNELSEALEQQTATSEVLNVISSSRFQLQPVFDTIVETATRLCRAEFSVIFRLVEGRLHVVAGTHAGTDFMRYLTEKPLLPDPGTAAGRCVYESRPIHIHDAYADLGLHLARGAAHRRLPLDFLGAAHARRHADRRHEPDAPRGRAVHRKADGAGHDVRRSGRDRYRERPPVRRGPGTHRRPDRIVAPANGHRRRPQGDQPFDLRLADRARHADRIGGPALRCRHGRHGAPGSRRLPARDELQIPDGLGGVQSGFAPPAGP